MSATLRAPLRSRLGPVGSACTALLDALDDTVTAPAVRARVLALAWQLDDDEQRQALAVLLFELADAFA